MCVCVFMFFSRPASLRGNLEGVGEDGSGTEYYKVGKRLIGHQSDAVGVEWSPDGRVLASCSLDGTICLWNADPASAQTLLVRLEHAHRGFVKGLAWDPSGRLLASQSDDGRCVVWNVEHLLALSAPTTICCSDDEEAALYREAVLEDMFHGINTMTFFHRPAWAPDGTLLALANAANRSIPVVALVERANWRGAGTSFVGHFGPVEVVRFSPVLFRTNDASRHEMMCAVASQDGQVSLWTSTRATPLVVLQDLFAHTVMDVAWSRDGRMLVAVSYDGTAAALRFSSFVLDGVLELTPLSAREQTDHLHSLFGQRKLLRESSQTGAYLEQVSVIAQLSRNEDVVRAVSAGTVETVGAIPSAVPSLIPQPAPIPPAIPPTIPLAQTVTVTKDGKRRITPQLVTIPTGGESSQSQHDTGTPRVGRMRAMFGGGGGTRLRDEDFIVHARLLERSATALVTRQTPSACIFAGGTEQIPAQLSLALGHSRTAGPFSATLEATNADVSGSAPVATVQLVQHATAVWRERMRGSVYRMAGGARFFALALGGERHSLLVLSRGGRRLLPLLELDSRVVALLACDVLCVVLTANGTLHMWNVAERRSVETNASLGRVLNAEETAVFVDLTLACNGPLRLVVSVAGRVMALRFQPALASWVHVDAVDAVDAVEREERKEESVQMIRDGGKSQQERMERIERLKGMMLVDASLAADRQLSELEFGLAVVFVSLHNGDSLSGAEQAHFERLLAMYALKLAKEAKVHKARELWEELQGLSSVAQVASSLLFPLFCQGNQSSLWQEFLATLSQ